MIKRFVLGCACLLVAGGTAAAQNVSGVEGLLVDVQPTHIVVNTARGRLQIGTTASTSHLVYKDINVESIPSDAEVRLHGMWYDGESSPRDWYVEWYPNGNIPIASSFRRESGSKPYWNLMLICRVVDTKPLKVEVGSTNNYEVQDAAGGRSGYTGTKPDGMILTLLTPLARAPAKGESPHRKVFGRSAADMQMAGKNAHVYAALAPSGSPTATSISVRRMEPLPP